MRIERYICIVIPNAARYENVTVIPTVKIIAAIGRRCKRKVGIINDGRCFNVEVSAVRIVSYLVCISRPRSNNNLIFGYRQSKIIVPRCKTITCFRCSRCFSQRIFFHLLILNSSATLRIKNEAVNRTTSNFQRVELRCSVFCRNQNIICIVSDGKRCGFTCNRIVSVNIRR